MKRPRKRLLYFLLLGVPTLFIGGSALFLLRQENRRLEDRFVTDTRIKAQALADRLADEISDSQETLMNQLRFQIEEPFLPNLLALKNQDPRIRHVFLWRSPGDVQVNPDRVKQTMEERRFLTRYQRLFAARGGLLQQVQSQVSNAAIQRQSNRVSSIAENRRDQDAFNWKVWFWEDQFSWLAWCGRFGERDSVVIGLELETMFMLATALATQQLPAGETTVYRILDHRDAMFHQTGAFPENREHIVEIPLGKVLPGWRLQATAPANAAVGAINFFAWPARILLVLLIVAVLLAGWALLRQADRDYRDALQKTNFVASVSHELKTPLTSISMYAEMLQAARVQDESKRAHYLDVIVNQTGRLTRLVNNVLTLGPLEQGKGRFNLRTVDLETMVGDTLATQLPRLKEEGFSLATKLESTRVVVDPDALTQVLLNLIDNALKYGWDDTRPKHLEVRVKAGDEFGELWVMDHGPGVPSKWRDAIFEKFFRGDESLTRKKGGSGIGLAIARLLIQGMDGTLRYGMQPTYGACFVVRLPKEGERT